MPGHLYQRGNIWWIKFAHQGKNYYTSAKSTKKADATRLLSMYLGQIAAGTFQGLKPPQREVVQFESQPSPLVALPSSHCSPAVTMPLPHPVGVQFESQPSPSMRLPSSQLSPPRSKPSPQTASQG